MLACGNTKLGADLVLSVIFTIIYALFFIYIMYYVMFYTTEYMVQWRRGIVVVTTAQLHSTKLVLRFCAGSNLAHGVSQIRDGEDL